MDYYLFLTIILSTSAFTKADDLGDDDSGGSFPHTAVTSSVGSVIFIVLVAYLIYYCCCRNKTPEGFSQFSNESDENPPRRRGRWKNKRFFRRNRHQNNAQNIPDPRPPTHVIIQPVVTLEVPSGDQNIGVQTGNSGTAPFMPTAPPAYDESLRNPPMPSQFMNPPMPSQFVNPPMPNQFMNPPMPSNFNNPPPMPSNFNNPPPMPSNFNNPPPMSGNFNNPPMQSGFSNLPPKNPNASSYHTRH